MLKVAPCTVVRSYGRRVVQPNFFGLMGYYYFEIDVDAVDWINVCNESNDIHEEAANCISILKQIGDKHAP